MENSTKIEQKKIKTEFLKDKESSIIYHKVNKVFVMGIIGVVFSLGAGIFDYLYHTGLPSYILDVLLFIFSVVFLFIATKIKKQELKKYIERRKKK